MNKHRTIEDWVAAIRCGETSTLQFKRELVNPKALAAELIAFANSKGGTLLYGIEDKTGEIVGLTYEEVQRLSREVGNAANEQIRPTLYLQTEVLRIEGRNVLAVYVGEGINKPYKDLNNNIWVKQGADKRRITENSEILRLFSTSKIYNPDEAPVAGTSLADLNDRKIDNYLQKVYNKGRDDFGIPYEQLMVNLRIATLQGELTLAGLLYFGSYPQRFKPVYCIKAVAFYGNDMGGTAYRDSKDLEGTIPELFDAAMHFLDLNLHHTQTGQSFNSLGVLEVSKIALEEILQNALCHREYIKQAPIRLLVFDNRIEIISPGALPDGLTVSEILLGNTAQRNPLICSFCTRTMHYRGLGTGIIRAQKESANIQFINDEVGCQFVAVIERKVAEAMRSVGISGGDIGLNVGINERDVSLNIGINGENVGLNVGISGVDVSLNEQKVIELIAGNSNITVPLIAKSLSITTRQVERIIANLKQQNIIRRVGSRKTGYWEIIK